MLEQQVVVDLGGQAQQVTQCQVLVDRALDSTELVQDQLIADVARACGAAAAAAGKQGSRNGCESTGRPARGGLVLWGGGVCC